MTHPSPPKILIVGSGIAGPALATFLLLSTLPAAAKPEVTVLERVPSLRSQGQNIDVRGTGVHILRKLGLEAIVRRHGTGEAGVQHVDAQNRVWAEIDAPRGEGSENQRAPTADLEILRGTLARILHERSLVVSRQVQEQGGKGIKYIFGDHVDEMEQDTDGVRVRFAKSGETRMYSVVVGADGLQSPTRKMIWGADGEETRLHKTGLYAVFFSIPHADTDTAYRRWYHAPGRRGIMTRPHEDADKTTVLLTVVGEAGEDVRLIDVATQHGGQGSVEAQKKLVEEYFIDAGWESDRVLRGMRETDDFYYDIVSQVKMDEWFKGRVVLLGDAGYCASPISGMGTTLALNGAYVLACALLEHPDQHEAAFSQYEARMRPLVKTAQKLAPGMPHILHPETAWVIWTLNMIGWLITASGLAQLLFRFMGPKADIAGVNTQSLRRLDEDGNIV